MRDLIRNYRMIIKGKPESDTDESQPLMSSSCSSTGSFGTITQPAIFQQDLDSSDSDCADNPKTPSSCSSNLSSRSLPTERQFERRMYYPSNFDTPELDILTKNQTIYDCYDNYSKIAGDLESQPILTKTKTTLNGSYINDYSDLEIQSTQNSMVTIFAVWNTTMGSSLLAISWGLEKSGLIPGILINLFVAAIALYTAYTILKVNEKHGIIGQTKEVSDLCKLLIGRWAEILAKIFSLVVLIGANIVYWILMSNFLYNSVLFLYGYLTAADANILVNTSSVICPKEILLNVSQLNFTKTEVQPSSFEKFWDLYSTVPVFLALLMFPMLNFKSATFFTKFNSLGTLSVLYLIFFAMVKAYGWGLHIPDWSLEFNFKPTFCALSGMLSLSYFIHNIIISIMKNNKHQENNGRDLTVAFGLVTFTYLIIGVLLYVTFPLAKNCIEDNILNNFDKYDTATIFARLLLLFQLFTVFPLMCYMLRNDIFSNINMIFKNYRFGDFSYGRVIFLNLLVVTVCILFACFLPKIGTLIRYTGAMSGLVYIFMLPSLLKIASLKKEGSLSVPKLLFHIFVIILGVLNLLSQFLISD